MRKTKRVKSGSGWKLESEKREASFSASLVDFGTTLSLNMINFTLFNDHQYEVFEFENVMLTRKNSGIRNQNVRKKHSCSFGGLVNRIEQRQCNANNGYQTKEGGGGQ